MMDEMVNAEVEQEMPCVEEQRDSGVEELAGIRQEIKALRAEVLALREPVQVVGLEPGQSGDFVPETDEMAFEAKLRRARDLGDTMTALRIKQEAAAAGVILF